LSYPLKRKAGRFSQVHDAGVKECLAKRQVNIASRFTWQNQPLYDCIAAMTSAMDIQEK
jgi:hypothetical protein